MSGTQSTASKRRRADSPKPSSDGAAAEDLYGVMTEMKSQLESLQQWKVSAEERLDRLQQQCAFLDKKCIALEESLIDHALRDPDWEYPEPEPDIDFEELGFEEGYNPFADIQNATISLMKSSLEERVGLGFEIGIVEDPVLMDDDEMMPHWRQLADAIRLMFPMRKADVSGGRLLFPRRVSLVNVQIPRVVQVAMAKALALKNFEKLTLINNHFDPVRGGEYFVRDILMNNASLKELFWDRNEILDAGFGRAIEKYNVLESITISRSCTDRATGMSLLRSILNASLCNANLTRIDLESNCIETGGDALLSDYISKNTPLQYLNLKGNRLNYDDALEIAQALHSNCNLIELNLENNWITNDGYNTIRRAMWSGDLTFSELYHCNHVCEFRPHADFEADGLPAVSNNTMSASGTDAIERAKDNLSAKIVSAFKDKISTNSLVSSLQMEFGDASLKLTPYILKAIHYYYTDHPATISFRMRVLGACFGLLRAWMVPEMYNSGSKDEQ